jgi:hypothetical protein
MDNVGADSVASGLTGPGGITRQNPYQQDGDWSLSATDVPSRLGVGFTEAIPIGKNQLIPISNRYLSAVLGGFYFGSVISAQSGWPSAIALGGAGWWNALVRNPTTGVITNNGQILPTGANLRPDIVPGTSCHTGLPYQGNLLTVPYLNAAHFAMPGSFGNPAFGNASRTLGDCRSPYVFQMNANAGKRINLGGTRSLMLGITASDVLNHPTYFSTGNNHSVFSALNAAYLTAPTANAPFLGNASFGLISSGNVQVRVVQLNARLSF